MRKMQIDAQFPYAYPFLIDGKYNFVVRSNVELISVKIEPEGPLVDVEYPIGKGFIVHPNTDGARDAVGLIHYVEGNFEVITVRDHVPTVTQNMNYQNDKNLISVDLSHWIADQTKWKGFTGMTLIFTDTAEYQDI